MTLVQESVNIMEKLPRYILSRVNAPENEIIFSSASVWEVVIKHAKNPAAMPVDGDAFVSGCIKAGFTPLPIENHHVLAVSGLKRKDGEGGVRMATSSITKNFVISGKEQIEAFADAIEAAANDNTPVRKVSARVLTDPKEIAKFMRKRKKANSARRQIYGH